MACGNDNAAHGISCGMKFLIYALERHGSDTHGCAHGGVGRLSQFEPRKRFILAPQVTSELPIPHGIAGQLALFFRVKVTNRQHIM
jgi:hypothetical protein